MGPRLNPTYLIIFYTKILFTKILNITEHVPTIVWEVIALIIITIPLFMMIMSSLSDVY